MVKMHRTNCGVYSSHKYICNTTLMPRAQRKIMEKREERLEEPGHSLLNNYFFLFANGQFLFKRTKTKLRLKFNC